MLLLLQGAFGDLCDEMERANQLNSSAQVAVSMWHCTCTQLQSDVALHLHPVAVWAASTH